MVFNYGPRGASGEHIDFNPGIGGGFNPLKNIQIKFGEEEYHYLQDGETVNKYFFKQGTGSQKKDWYLIIFDSCDLTFTKEIKNVEIGAIGAGGGGGKEVTAPGNPGGYDEFYPLYYRAGGGGGAGGYRIKKIFNVFEQDNYTLTIGAPNEEYGDGGYTSIQNDSNVNIIIANGGKKGDTSTIDVNGQSVNSKWVGYGYGTPGEGGVGTYSNNSNFNTVPIGTEGSPESASGGKGGQYGKNSSRPERAPQSGSFGQSFFEAGIFGNISYSLSSGAQINDMIIVGAGGGGGGSTDYNADEAWPSASYSAPPNGIDSIYGRGGNGTGGGVAGIDPRLGQKGLIIIRHKESTT